LVQEEVRAVQLLGLLLRSSTAIFQLGRPASDERRGGLTLIRYRKRKTIDNTVNKRLKRFVVVVVAVRLASFVQGGPRNLSVGRLL
jgi:hypothetical protein